MTATDLEGQLDNLSLRLVVTRLVYRDVTPYVDDDALVDRVVENVVRGWQQRDQDASMQLDGPDGYWNRYADQVEWAPGSGEDSDVYRLEFCPDDSEPFNEHNYYEAVWYTHIAGLPARGGAGGVNDDAGTRGQRTG
ncbi:hypothetical protein [Rugosimonospora africana]|uniref:hypothetical protein n=1 Tax=Rugosimonospora africana TaxID=556532 RepID=UPI00194468DE|nr:hypothetical protein [Rugosimonospora africana]